MMGLSPYGKNIYEEKIFSELVTLFEDGSFQINQKYFNFSNDDVIITKELEKFFSLKKRKKKDKILQIHCDIAASIQTVIEKIIFKIIDSEIILHKTNNIILAGGVALNCVANGKIEKNIKKIYIFSHRQVIRVILLVVPHMLLSIHWILKIHKEKKYKMYF